MKHHTSKRLLAFLLSLMLLPFGAFMSLSGLLPGMTSLSAEAAGEQPGYPNLDYTFNSVNETPVSSKGAPGQITLIVFGHIRCGNTSWTLKSIAGSNWINDPNIRVIFAECNSADANTTKNFANTYCG